MHEQDKHGADHHASHGDGCRHDHIHSHGHSLDTAALMQRADAYAACQGLKMTPMRAEVLMLLMREQKPLTAYEIVDRLGAMKKVQAVQVYRALEFLQNAACVHRLASRSSYFACDHVHAAGEAVLFMVCSDCGSVAEAPSEAIARGLHGVVEAADFRAVTPILEVEGQCPNCAGAQG